MDGLWLLAAEVAGSSCHNYYTIKKKKLKRALSKEPFLK